MYCTENIKKFHVTRNIRYFSNYVHVFQGTVTIQRPRSYAIGIPIIKLIFIMEVTLLYSLRSWFLYWYGPQDLSLIPCLFRIIPINMPVWASTGPVLVRCPLRPSTGPVLAHNDMFTGIASEGTISTQITEDYYPFFSGKVQKKHPGMFRPCIWTSTRIGLERFQKTYTR